MSNKSPIPSYNKSIAVLPFVNISNDSENEYFSDGITEEIINALTNVKGLKVIARTSSFSFKNKNVDVRTIGNQLGVSTVLEGSVRRAQNTVRITAQLINTNDGTHIWSKNFDRNLEDIFAVQDEISLQIADQIRENFGHLDVQDHLIEVSTQNIVAYDLYLKGRYQHLMWDGQGIRNAVELYERCVSIEPSFDLPYFGLGYSYAMYGSWGNDKAFLELSKKNLGIGFKLDKQSYLGYFGKATLSFWGEWDFINGYKYFQKAIELNPSYTEAEEGLCELYTAIGYFDNALKNVSNILRINPLSPNHYFTKANIHYLTNDYLKALECIDISLSINPNFTQPIALKQLCLILLNDYEKLDEFLAQNPLAERPEECRVLYKLVNQNDPVNIDMTKVGLMIKEDFGSCLLPWQLFLLVHMKKHEMALDFLEDNIKARTGQVINFMNIPLLKPLHQYQRFQNLVHSVFNEKLLPSISENQSQIISLTPKALMSDAEINSVLKNFERGMKDDKWFLNPTLTLRELAGYLKISSNKLSWLLNERIGQNFREYINGLRLEYFKQNALKSENSRLTFLALAYESGFNSKSVFNAFFKKNEGITPKAWLKSKRG
ncbi:MAG: helix-turn-helix domain-containing protein [Bacteroidia bacterium]